MSQRPFDYTKAEMIAGAFVILGVALLGYLSISIGGFKLFSEDRYRISARFSNVGDLKAGAPIKLAGVTVGKVASIKLVDYFGEVVLAVDRGVQLPKDTIASVATAGLLGDAYLSLSPGGADANLADGDRISRTEPALNLADLLGRYAFGATDDGGGMETPEPQKRAHDQEQERPTHTAPSNPIPEETSP
jgi:phospholipid/cholesterol/gamma-HCH transport system substrate-binding protein